MLTTFGQNLHKGGEVVGDNLEDEDADAMERETITLLLTQGDAKVALPGLTTESPEQQLIPTQCQQCTKKQEQTSLQQMQEQLQLQKEACSILQHQNNRLFHAEHAHQKQLCQRLKMLHKNLLQQHKLVQQKNKTLSQQHECVICIEVCPRYTRTTVTHYYKLNLLRSAVRVFMPLVPRAHTGFSECLLLKREEDQVE